ncbi:uncharacterized protein [Ptychodera flava]|uniref:uncharacterized protein n=1 Tax=Ptychodera flava TaxID=63121 RepID=UPI00396A5550
MNPRDKSWLKVDQSELSVENNVVVPVKFTVDEKYVNVRTKHFTKFTCSSCGKQRPIFAMDAVAYGKYIPEREQVAVKVYLCDTIKETKVRVAAEERCYSNKSAIGIKPKVADGDWQISCLDNPSEKDWKWQINETEGLLPRTQVKTMNEIVSCCSESLPPYAEFLFEPKLTSECGPPNYFKVYFALQQSLPGEMTEQEQKILSLDLSVNKVPTSGEQEQGNFDPQHNLGLPRDTICDPSGLQKVCKELDLFQAKSLVRTLLPNHNCEADLENIEHNNHDTREKKYQFLIYWPKVAGIRATYEALYNALIKEEMRKAAEVVAEIWRYEAGRKKPKMTQV